MSVVITQDLRAAAKDYQRARNHNAKWARGFAPAQGKSCSHVGWSFEAACDDCAKKPQHRDSDRRCGRHYSGLRHHQNEKMANHKSNLARKVFRNEVVEATDGPLANISDSSGEEEMRDEYPKPVPDMDVMYSYDLSRGPGRGHDILSTAISQALVRFENKVTEKLAKEYDFADDGKDLGLDALADPDDEDFELIEHAHLH